MSLGEIAKALGLEVRAGAGLLERPVSGGQVGDLLSSIMALGSANQVWVTIQIHPNIVAVGVVLNLAAIIIAGGQEPEAATLARAEDERLPILTTPMRAYEVVGKLYELGVR